MYSILSLIFNILFILIAFLAIDFSVLRGFLIFIGLWIIIYIIVVDDL
jgi:hypothetical protein